MSLPYITYMLYILISKILSGLNLETKIQSDLFAFENDKAV